MKIRTLDDAQKRITELEEEIATLRTENEILRSRNFGGRKKHDDTWMAAYREFAVKYENGMAIMEIVAEGKISRRTAYRYLAYYKELKKRSE